DHLFGRAHTRVPAAVSGREIVHRAGFAGKEQTAADWRRELRPAVGKSRRRVRIRTERKRISTPAMNGNRPDARRKCVAEKPGEARHGAIKKSVIAAALQFGGKATAEIGLDHRSPERPEVIVGCGRTIDVSEHPRVRLEFLGTGKGNE